MRVFDSIPCQKMPLSVHEPTVPIHSFCLHLSPPGDSTGSMQYVLTPEQAGSLLQRAQNTNRGIPDKNESEKKKKN